MTYTESEKIERAEHAERLVNDALLNEALEAVGMSALRELSQVDASNVNEILRLQAIVHCVDEMTGYIEGVITASGAYDGGVSIQK